MTDVLLCGRMGGMVPSQVKECLEANTPVRTAEWSTPEVRATSWSTTHTIDRHSVCVSGWLAAAIQSSRSADTHSNTNAPMEPLFTLDRARLRRGRWR